MVRRAVPLAWFLLLGCFAHRWTATPDGQVLALFKDKEIFVTDADLNVLERYPCDDDPAIVEISPDGKKVAYNTESTEGLWVIDRQSKAQTKIAEGKGLLLWGGWSPDSKELAYVRTQKREGAEDRYTLEVFDLAQGKVRASLERSGVIAAWSLNGQHLFTTRPHEPAGSGEQVLGTVVRWSRDGTLKELCEVAYVAYVEPLDGAEVLVTAFDMKLPRKAGTKLDLEETPAHLYRLSLETGELHRLVDERIAWVTLSPDWRHFIAMGWEGKPRITLYETSGRRVRTVWEGSTKSDRPPMPPPFWVGPDRFIVVHQKKDGVQVIEHRVKEDRPRDLSSAYEALK